MFIYTHDRVASVSGYAVDHALTDSFKRGDRSETKTVKSLESTVSEVRDWLRVNYLKMNNKKTEYKLFANKQHRPICLHSSILISGENVPAANSMKYLRANLDEQLTFKNILQKDGVRKFFPQP